MSMVPIVINLIWQQFLFYLSSIFCISSRYVFVNIMKPKWQILYLKYFVLKRGLSKFTKAVYSKGLWEKKTTLIFSPFSESSW